MLYSQVKTVNKEIKSLLSLVKTNDINDIYIKATKVGNHLHIMEQNYELEEPPVAAVEVAES